MSKYRIIKYESNDDDPIYEVQKRFLGFLWWYNFKNIDGIESGFYDTLEEAEEVIRIYQSKLSRSVVKVFN